LGLIELIAKFDPIIKENLRRIHDDEIHDHYLGKSIQNELISIMALKVKEVGLRKLSIILSYWIVLQM